MCDPNILAAIAASAEAAALTAHAATFTAIFLAAMTVLWTVALLWKRK